MEIIPRSEANEAIRPPLDPLYDRVHGLLQAVAGYAQAKGALDDIFLGPQSGWPTKIDPVTGQPETDKITGVNLKVPREELLGDYLNNRIVSLRGSYLDGVQKETTEHFSTLDYFFTSKVNSLANLDALKEEARVVSREKARTHRLTGEKVVYIQNESNGFLFAYINEVRSQAETEHQTHNPVNSAEFRIDNKDGSLRQIANENFDKTVSGFIDQMEHMMGVEKWRNPGRSAIVAASRTTRKVWTKPSNWYKGDRQHKANGDRPLTEPVIPGRVADHDTTTDRMMFEHTRRLKKFVSSFKHPTLDDSIMKALDEARDSYLTDTVSGLPKILGRLQTRLGPEKFSEALHAFLDREVVPLLKK